MKAWTRPKVVAVTLVGAPARTIAVVMELLGKDESEVPALLVAATLKVYEIPGFKPFTVIDPELDWARVPTSPPGNEIAVYEVIVAPPFVVGAVKVTEALVCVIKEALVSLGAEDGIAKVVAEFEEEDAND